MQVGLRPSDFAMLAFARYRATYSGSCEITMLLNAAIRGDDDGGNNSDDNENICGNFDCDLYDGNVNDADSVDYKDGADATTALGRDDLVMAIL